MKSLLLEQEVIAGLGNIYADEILFLSKINPLKKCNELNDIELEVKNRVESYMNSTGLKESESIERVVTMVSRQTSSMTLKDSKQISSWENPNDNFIYILVAIPKANIEKTINSEVQKALDSLDKI